MAGRMILAELASAITSLIEGNTPKLEDEVTVEIVGQPGSNKRTLFQMAMSTAFGIARPGAASGPFAVPPALVMVEYDASSDWVRVTLRYKVGVLNFLGGINVLNPNASINALRALFGTAPVVRGPAGSFRAGIPFVPFGPFNIRPEAGNPFINTIPLTENATWFTPGGAVISTPNPKPPGDNRSRGAIPDRTGLVGGSDNPVMQLIPLMFSALSAPGSVNLQVITPPAVSTLGGG